MNLAKPTSKPTPSRALHALHGAEPDLAKATLRAVGALLLACVVFVGGLSAIAVVVTSRVVGAPETPARATGAKPVDQPVRGAESVPMRGAPSLPEGEKSPLSI